MRYYLMNSQKTTKVWLLNRPPLRKVVIFDDVVITDVTDFIEGGAIVNEELFGMIHGEVTLKVLRFLLPKLSDRFGLYFGTELYTLKECLGEAL